MCTSRLREQRDQVAAAPTQPTVCTACPASPYFVGGPDFARMWTAGLAHCLKRFEGKSGLFAKEPSGGIGCFTPGGCTR